MFLKSITVENLRSIQSAQLVLDREDPRWTLILGENGCGKSTLLRAIAMVMAGRAALPSFLVDPSSWIRLGASSARIAAVITTEKGLTRTLELTIRRGRDVSKILEENATSLKLLDAALQHTNRSYFTVGYGVSRRVSSAIVKDQESLRVHPRFSNVATLFAPDASLISIESWAADLYYRRGKAGESIIRRTLDGLLPDVKFHGLDKNQRRILFETTDGVVPLSQLSDGYQSVCAWAGDLLYRITETFDDYLNPLKTRGLLLLDEIELHLHPRWQRALRRYIQEKFPNLQVVATTHAALTAQLASEGELWVARRNSKGVPELSPYEGDPQKLQVQHLLLSDAFGLESLSSPLVEQYRDLKAKKKRGRLSTSEQSELATISDRLGDAGDDPQAPNKELEELLQQIADDLEGQPAPEGRAGRQIQRKKGSVKKVGRKKGSIKKARRKKNR